MSDIDLTKILEGCPEGTEFYHKAYGTVRFILIDIDSEYPILLSINGDSSNGTALSKYGKLNVDFDGECLLFPSKEQQDWSKFERFWDKSKIERFNPKTFQPFDKILVRDNSSENWSAALFSHICYDLSEYDLDGSYNMQFIIETTGSSDFSYCIPFNDETKHLIGTTNDCPEYYKWWEE